MIKAKKVCFYSYKGGTGRSTALANVATYLASKGKRVGCIDLDIESPGLNYIFKIKPGGNTITKLLRKNILEYEEIVPTYIVDLKSDSCDIEDAELKKKMRELKGELYLMPATTEYTQIGGLEYPKKLVNNMREIIRQFSENKMLDYILLDSRSGVSDPSSLAQLVSNIILFFFRLDRQGRKSAYKWIDWYDTSIGQSTAPQVCLIASNVPTGGVAEDIMGKVNNSLGKRKINHRLDREPCLELEEEIIVIKNLKCESDIKSQYEQLGEMLLKEQG